jgi:hypothetical protein
LVNLLLNGTDGDKIMGTADIVNITAQIISGEGEIQLLENSTLLGSNNTNFSIQKQYSTAGNYNITAYYPETGNYTSSQEEHTLTINDTTPPNITGKSPSGTITSTSPTLTVNTDETSV